MKISGRPSWPIYLIGSLLAVGVLVVATWNIELPYLAYSPGPVADAADAIIAPDVEVYPPEGELLMLTILSQDVNVFDALIAGVDPTIDLVRKEAVRRPGETDEEYRNRVLEQMDDSNFVAIQVALATLGYPQEVVITEVLGAAPAAQVLEPGDVILEVDGVEIGVIEDVSPVIEGHEPGDVITILLERSGERRDVQVQLAEREDEPGVPMVGVVLRRLVDAPFAISIEEGDIGGPSAGLMHSLAIVDMLSEGELTKGHVVAGTGTIDFDGNVGAIGGIRQKVPAAEAAGAGYLLVPEGNYEAALTAERDEIEIVAVASIEEALAFLDSLEPA
jgi:PDZ domain-containing protein